MCDMGARQRWGRKKWASLHLLRYAAPQCLLFLPEVPRVVCAAAYCQHERRILYADSTTLVSFNGMCMQYVSVRVGSQGFDGVDQVCGFKHMAKLTFWSTSHAVLFCSIYLCTIIASTLNLCITTAFCKENICFCAAAADSNR